MFSNVYPSQSCNALGGAMHCLTKHWVQVVPEARRSSVYAFNRCFEGAISALSAPLVGLIAERWFHYRSASQGSTPRQQLRNATALGDGLLVCSTAEKHDDSVIALEEERRGGNIQGGQLEQTR